MRRLLSGGLVMFAGVVSLPSPVLHHQKVEPIPVAAEQPDPRVDTLKRFFSDCPAADLANVFLETADEYDLDWRLLPSISFVESSGGKAARNNNLFGWDSGRAEFATLSASIQKVAYFLANSNLYRDKNLDELLRTYNPNAEYAGKVKSVMRQIAPTE
jgi:hypothetical protein